MKTRRYKLLLDENCYTRDRFPILNNRHDLKHIAHDFPFAGLPDVQVYAFACKEKRLILTYNRKDFEPMASKSRETGIISISKTLSNEQIDRKLTALLSRATPRQLYGHFHHISMETHTTEERQAEN